MCLTPSCGVFSACSGGRARAFDVPHTLSRACDALWVPIAEGGGWAFEKRGKAGCSASSQRASRAAGRHKVTCVSRVQPQEVQRGARAGCHLACLVINLCVTILQVPSRLSLQHLSAYLESEKEKKRMLEDRRRCWELEKLEKELSECTWAPATNPLPPYLIRHHLTPPASGISNVSMQ